MAKTKKNGTPAEEKVEKFTRQLRVALTEKELAERADRAAHVVRERDGKEEDRKAANTAAKAQIEELDAELKRLSGEVRDKATYALVECERVYDYKLGQVREVRTDTRVVLDLRAMRADERQLTNGLEDPAPATDPADEARKLSDAAASDEPPLPTQKRGKPKAKKQGKARGAARAEVQA
jgi:hypothetical protein